MSAQLNSQDLLTALVEKAKLNPNWFCEEFLKSPNDPWQEEMMDAVADLDRARVGLPTIHNHDLLNRFTVRAFHGPGKTHIIAKLMHWWNFTRKGRIPVTAPKEKQLRTRVWPEFRKVRALARDDYRSIMKVDATSISWFNDIDWCAIAETAASPENLQGLHDDWILYLIEEASGVSEEMFPAIEGALSTDGAVLFMIGNPTRTTGEFYNSHCKRGTMELYYKKAIQHHETNRISQKWVDGMIAKYGIDSPVVQVRVFGNFVEMEERQLLALQWLVDAIGKDWEPDGSIPRYRISVDVADGGLDDNIVSVAIDYDSFKYLRKQHKFNFPAHVTTPKLFRAIKRIYESLVNEFPDSDGDVVVDAVGVGTGVAGLLIEDGIPTVAYKGGAASDDAEQWANRRTQSYMCYRDDLRDGRVVIAEDYCDEGEWDDFLAQHVSIKTAEGAEKREELETKKSMRARGIKSPDMPDAIKQHWATDAPTINGCGDLLLGITSEVAQHAW